MTAVQDYIDVYYSALGNGMKSMESGNHEQAQIYFTRARLSLSYAIEQLDVGCKAEIYSNEYCQGMKADILQCKMDAVTFYENAGKLLELSNPEINCKPTMEFFESANAKCTILREQYPGLLDEWKNITPPEKIRTMCNLTDS